jgi:hypothetical protein
MEARAYSQNKRNTSPTNEQKNSDANEKELHKLNDHSMLHELRCNGRGFTDVRFLKADEPWLDRISPGQLPHVPKHLRQGPAAG